MTTPTTDQSPVRGYVKSALPIATFLAGAIAATGLNAVANTGSPDVRLDQILSLVKAQQTCDKTCIAELRAKADRTDALEQALASTQWSQPLDIPNAGTSQLEQRLALLEAKLEQRSGVQQPGPSLTERRDASQRRKADPKMGAADRIVIEPTPTAKPVASLAPKTNKIQDWSVIGMAARTVVIASPDHRAVALAIGESLDGVTVKAIDPNRGIVDTSDGTLVYRR